MVGFDFLYGYDISSDGQRFFLLVVGEARKVETGKRYRHTIQGRLFRVETGSSITGVLSPAMIVSAALTTPRMI